MSGIVVEVSARKFTVPFECVCCGQPPHVEIVAAHTRVTGKRVIRETTRSLTFPYCNSCNEHRKAWDFGHSLTRGMLFLGVVLGITTAAAGGGSAGWPVFFVVWLVGVALGISQRTKARSMCSPTCAAAPLAVRHLGWNGSISSFAFDSSRYAVSFANGNSRGLVNVSMQLRELINRAQHTSTPSIARPMLSQPVVSQPVVGPRDLVLEWIARIEDLKGAEARRTALQRALDEIHDVGARQRLVLAASRIEVAAVLDKVDSLKSPQAKKRHLEKAIDDLRRDSIPDVMQTEEFRQLNVRLRELA